MERFKRWVFIGDLHGNFEVATKTAYWALEQKAKPIFMGDLTDSFSKTKKAQLYCIQFIRNMFDAGAICLWGNHDLSYINPGAFCCSGYSKAKDAYFKEAYSDLLRHESFTPFYYIADHNVLITHAGFDPSLIPEHYLEDIHPSEILAKAFTEDNAIALTTHTKFTNVGRYSGGYGVGGITWARPQERTGPLPQDIIQVAGHTPQKTCNFNSNDNTWYIDSLEYGDRSILMLDEHGNFEVIEEQRWNLKEQ